MSPQTIIADCKKTLKQEYFFFQKNDVQSDFHIILAAIEGQFVIVLCTCDEVLLLLNIKHLYTVHLCTHYLLVFSL